MKRNSSIFSKITTFIFWIILIIICIKVYSVYKSLYFNGFTKVEYIQGNTEFTRDNIIKYGKDRSYKMYSKDYTDAMFYKEIDVKPNTAYKVSCIVKTENVELENDNLLGGAMICLAEELDESVAVVGTNDWQEISLMFNSKNRDKVKIGFRLGGNHVNAKGTVWFDNLKLEEGITNTSTTWKMGCFILKHVNVNIDGEQYKFDMSMNDIETARSNIERFEKDCKVLSNNQMVAQCDIYEVDDEINTISYSEEHKYYIGEDDIEKYIGNLIIENEYDYVFTVVRMGNDNKEIPTEKWIGLGGMTINNIGYSTIRMSNNSNNYIYTYHASINTFPEEVYLHEFLHTLERILNEYDYEIPELHDYSKYNYSEDSLNGLKDWYKDYMLCQINDTKSGEKIGLNSEVYSFKPPHNSDFEFKVEVDFNKEPANIIEDIKSIIKAFSTTVETLERSKNIEIVGDG